jgi:hypothetical protein
MIKNWKNLFVKHDEEQPHTSSPNAPLSFPVNTNTPSTHGINKTETALQDNEPIIREVMEVYEKGLESINMPGYDFYEFYQTVYSTGQTNEQTYKMAFQMAKTLDRTITPDKLLSDAEFYISKINEVHSQYISQGQQKLNGIQQQKTTEKNKLQHEIDQAALRISQLRAELQQLETDISQKRNAALKIEDNYYPKEKSIREKLTANDFAQKASISKLSSIREGIQKYIKN